MINVGHLLKRYLPQSETFIWQYLHAFRDIRPIVIAYASENLSQFPLPEGTLRLLSGRRGSLAWLMDNLNKRLWDQPLRSALSIIKREQIEILHAHYGFNGTIFLPILSDLSLPLVTTFYGADLSSRDLIKAYQDKYKDLFRRGHLFLVEGSHMKDQLIALGCPGNKIQIQRIAIDLRNYALRLRTWNGSRPVRFLFIGRFVEKKGLEYALKALAIVGKNFPFEFHIIGNGDLSEQMHRLAEDLGLGDRVHWLGMQRHERVIDEIKNCDILLQPSVTARDGDSEGGAPTVILEAQACGVPIVTTSHADIPNITDPGKSALLSPEKDVPDLAEHIRFLLEHPDEWKDMGKYGRNYVEKYHNVDTEVLSLTEKYRTLLQGHYS